jgi:hypothetical protein
MGCATGISQLCSGSLCDLDKEKIRMLASSLSRLFFAHPLKKHRSPAWNFHGFWIVLSGSIAPTTLQASVAQLHGSGAIVGEYLSNHPSQSTSLQGWRVPLSLTLEAKAAPSFSLFLNLDYGRNAYPASARYLGNTADNATSKEVATPFSGRDGTVSLQDKVQVGYAYLQYASDIGLVRAGRMPRHWGLGLWRNAQPASSGGGITTTDSLAISMDFTSTFTSTISWDKYNEGSPSALTDDADGLSIELMVADDLTDPSSSTISKKFGLAYSTYDHKATSTKLRILDLFASLRTGPLGLDLEVLYPNEGGTKDLGFARQGGPKVGCPIPGSKEVEPIACDSYSIEGLAALMKWNWLVSGTAPSQEQDWLSSYEVSRLNLPTAQRRESHILGLTLGYSKGDSDAYDGVPYESQDRKITLAGMHSNVKAGFLMNSENTTQVSGMPGGNIQNMSFAKLEYTFETPSYGMFSPSVVWGRLDRMNSKSAPASEQDKVYGFKSRNLGVELDLKYSYQTQDRVNFGLEGGAWFVGQAWRKKGSGKPSPAFGLRGEVSTSF